jgi:hypothetical protein
MIISEPDFDISPSDCRESNTIFLIRLVSEICMEVSFFIISDREVLGQLEPVVVESLALVDFCDALFPHADRTCIPKRK